MKNGQWHTIKLLSASAECFPAGNAWSPKQVRQSISGPPIATLRVRNALRQSLLQEQAKELLE
jgi:hypothetical protein